MRTFKLLWIISILVSLALPVKASAGGLLAQRNPAKEQARLEKEIRHEILTLPYYGVFDAVGYQLDGDKATLTGSVVLPTTKSDAERAVKSIEGVASVANNIEVLPPSPGDDHIRRAIFRAIYGSNSPLFRYGTGSLKAIHIIVKGGNVTLLGTVDSEGDKTFAGMRAKSVPGTFSVTNNITVGK